MTLTSKFNSTCRVCGCKINTGDIIEWSQGIGARHATVQQCEEAKRIKIQLASAAAPARVVELGLKAIVDFLTAARDRGLKSPKLRVLSTDGKTELRLGITKAGIAPGSLSVVEGGSYLGSIRPNGEVAGRDLPLRKDLLEHLKYVAQNPAAAAKEYAALMGLCSFCGKQLTDAGSVEVGYGPICAEKWGLPHTPKGTPVLQKVGQP